MATYALRAVLPYNSGLPRDVSINQWAVICPATALPSAMAAVASFYSSTTYAGGHTLGYYLANILDRTANACRVEATEMSSDPTHGPPIAIEPFTLAGAATGSTDLPAEVALCTSFAAAGTEPAGRRRGRVYVGPFNAVLAGRRPPGQFVIDLAQATHEMQTTMALAGVSLAIWSRADNVPKGVVRGWVDNAWDTQRRRGERSTDRYTWTAD